VVVGCGHGAAAEEVAAHPPWCEVNVWSISGGRVDYARRLSWEVCILRARQIECCSCICPDACVWYVDIAERTFVCVGRYDSFEYSIAVAQTRCQLCLPLVAGSVQAWVR
jgi:hypothetical protein